MSIYASALFAIPKEPNLQIVSHASGYFFNFLIVTQGKGVGDDTKYQTWKASLFVHSDKKDEWVERVKPGNTFFAEGMTVMSLPTPDDKYTWTKVKLDSFKTRQLAIPLWYKE